MSGKVFLDSNILIYLNDFRFPHKQHQSILRVKEIYKNGNGVISTQVINEFYVISVKKLKLDPVDVRRQIDSLLDFEIMQIDITLIKEAIDCSILDRINYWDALMVVCAQRGGCGVLWTEDLNDGQMIKNVKIENIFK